MKCFRIPLQELLNTSVKAVVTGKREKGIFVLANKLFRVFISLKYNGNKCKMGINARVVTISKSVKNDCHLLYLSYYKVEKTFIFYIL